MTQAEMPSLRKVIVTGISGCGYKERLQSLQQEGHVVWLDMGDTIMDIAAEYDLGYYDATILDAPKKELALLRALASERIMARVRELRPGDCVAVSLHATFKWKGVVVPGFDFHFLQTLGADAYVNYIDDVDDSRILLILTRSGVARLSSWTTCWIGAKLNTFSPRVSPLISAGPST